MHAFRVLWGGLIISAQRELAFRSDLVFQAIRMAIELAAGLAALALVYSRTDVLSGWKPAETLGVLGFYTVMTGVLQAFLEPNLAFFAATIVQPGKLDDLLLRPVPNVLLASLGTCQPWALTQVPVGTSVAIIGTIRATGAPGGERLAACLVLFTAGVAILWSTRVLLAATAFWAPHLEPEVLYDAFWQLGRYPIAIYPPAVARLLTFVLPVALIVTFPAQALTRGADSFVVIAGPLAGLGSVAVTMRVWQAGLRRYTSATS